MSHKFVSDFEKALEIKIHHTFNIHRKNFPSPNEIIKLIYFNGDYVLHGKVEYIDPDSKARYFGVFENGVNEIKAVHESIQTFIFEEKTEMELFENKFPHQKLSDYELDVINSGDYFVFKKNEFFYPTDDISKWTHMADEYWSKEKGGPFEKFIKQVKFIKLED